MRNFDKVGEINHKKGRLLLALIVGLSLLTLSCEKKEQVEIPTSMPDLIGLTYKEAENLLQGTPLDGVLTYEDLKGDRSVWKESNWTVVSQEPNPGSGFSEATNPCVGVIKTEEISTFPKSKAVVCSKHTTFLEETATKATTTTSSEPTTSTSIYITRDEIFAAAEQMRTEKDQVKNIVFVSDKSSPTKWSNSFYLYIGTSSGSKPWLRLHASYSGSEWIFWSKLIFNVDDNIYTSKYSSFEVKRDNSGSRVYEWLDVEVPDSQLPRLRAIAESQSTVIRFEGDSYINDMSLSSSQKKALSNVLAVYDGLERGVLSAP
jgi:hypothetical protein